MARRVDTLGYGTFPPAPNAAKRAPTGTLLMPAVVPSVVRSEPVDEQAPATRADNQVPSAAPAPASGPPAWFTPVDPTTLLMTPIGGELEARRGWKPPSRSSGILFAFVSVMLITSAIAGTAFFLTPPPPPPSGAAHSLETTETTTETTGAAVATATASATAPPTSEPSAEPPAEPPAKATSAKATPAKAPPAMPKRAVRRAPPAAPADKAVAAPQATTGEDVFDTPAANEPVRDPAP